MPELEVPESPDASEPAPLEVAAPEVATPEEPPPPELELPVSDGDAASGPLHATRERSRDPGQRARRTAAEEFVVMSNRVAAERRTS